jgi:hypothetical protein
MEECLTEMDIPQDAVVRGNPGVGILEFPFDSRPSGFYVIMGYILVVGLLRDQ